MHVTLSAAYIALHTHFRSAEASSGDVASMVWLGCSPDGRAEWSECRNQGVSCWLRWHQASCLAARIADIKLNTASIRES
jgi:hypothetical protein